MLSTVFAGVASQFFEGGRRGFDTPARGITFRGDTVLIAATRIVYLVWAAWLIVGGILGFARSESRSVISLVAGAVTGVLAITAAGLLARNPTTGLWLGLATAVLVLGSFVPRFLRSPNFYPGGLTILLSAIALAATIAALVAARSAVGR